MNLSFLRLTSQTIGCLLALIVAVETEKAVDVMLKGEARFLPVFLS